VAGKGTQTGYLLDRSKRSTVFVVSLQTGTTSDHDLLTDLVVFETLHIVLLVRKYLIVQNTAVIHYQILVLLGFAARTDSLGAVRPCKYS
jgi:hypothetical protein